MLGLGGGVLADALDRRKLMLMTQSALALVSLIGILVGTALGKYLPEDLLHKLAASAFIIIGALMLWGKL